MDPTTLESTLRTEFGATDRAAHVVARQARDLADSGQITSDFDYELTAAVVVSNLRDAPAEYSLVERWNWWLGSLELSHGGYEQFRIRPGAV
ncbi:hypothetical protein [Halapricum hydrolyticum]|uniref:Uncharacterized protein n=1 Tax=Halapricum hydrolyticum TaxID=2979991 RepID=A0AAE3IFS6_9EURY|nr:hypothetical protein [Halapricum hydrolyticum]MCU4718556.1 hypothetical protein [Halapricum hydrolyticum]MCU4727595.1 hypothetical protein [Halapricum hydrolyticum]